MLYMFRTILVHHQEQLYKLYIAFGICRYMPIRLAAHTTTRPMILPLFWNVTQRLEERTALLRGYFSDHESAERRRWPRPSFSGPEHQRSLSIPLQDVRYSSKSVLTTIKLWEHIAENTETLLSAFTCCSAFIRLWGLMWNFRRDLLLTRLAMRFTELTGSGHWRYRAYTVLKDSL